MNCTEAPTGFRILRQVQSEPSLPSEPGSRDARAHRATDVTPCFSSKGCWNPDHRRGTGDEAKQVHRRADHRGAARAGGGAAVAELCRKHGISSATFYAWKAKFGGMDVSEAKRLKALEAEHAKLKRLYADAMLDNAGLKELLTKKW